MHVSTSAWFSKMVGRGECDCPHWHCTYC